MESKSSYTVKVSEVDVLESGRDIMRFAPRDSVSPGSSVNLKGPNAVYSGEVVEVNDNPLFGDKVICTIRKR